MSKGGVNQGMTWLHGFLSTGLASSRRRETHRGMIGSRGTGAPGQEGMQVPNWSLGGVGHLNQLPGCPEAPRGWGEGSKDEEEATPDTSTPVTGPWGWRAFPGP